MQKLIIGFNWNAVCTKKRLWVYSLLAAALVLLGVLELLRVVPPYWFLNTALTVLVLGVLELALIPVSNQFGELGLFLAPSWFLKHGVRGVVTFTGATEGSGTVFSGVRWGWGVNYSASGVKKLHARGINPVTFEEQEFIQLWTSAAAQFRPGDKFFIYVHSDKPRLVYWIDVGFSFPVERMQE